MCVELKPYSLEYIAQINLNHAQPVTRVNCSLCSPNCIHSFYIIIPTFASDILNIKNNFTSCVR